MFGTEIEMQATKHEETSPFERSYQKCLWKVNMKIDFQNKGIAKTTMQHIETELRQLGVDAIRLDAFTENPYALSLYENLGYKIVGYADWRKGRFYLMEKCIDEPKSIIK